VLDSLQIAAQVMPNLPMRDAVKAAAAQGARRRQFFARTGRQRLLPAGRAAPDRQRRACWQLERMLEEAANQEQRELDRWMTLLTAVLGPLVILLVGAMVLFIVLAILLPIFNLNQMVK
jgi:general secretion pathway protein F